MEKSIHTHLFAAVASLREQRLVHFAETPEQKQFDAAAARIEASIEDPSQGFETPLEDMTELRIMVAREALTGSQGRIDQLTTIVNKKSDLLRQINETEQKTADDNQDWQKVKEGFESADEDVKEEAIDAARKLILDSIKSMNDLSGTILNLEDLEPRLLAKTTAKLIAAHNKNIVNVQALDPLNTVALVEPRTGGKKAQEELDVVKKDGEEFMDDEFDGLVKSYEDASTASAKATRLKKIDQAILDRREDIYTEINRLTGKNPPYVNIQEMVAELLGQIKLMNEERAKLVGASTPSSSEEAPATAEVPEDALKDVPSKKVDALVAATNEADFKNALAALNEETSVKGDTVDIAAALNTKLTAFKVKANGTVLEIDTSAPAAPAASQDVNEKVTELRQMIEIIKEFLEWLFQQNGVMKPGNDVASMRTRIASMKAEEDKLRLDPKFRDDPEMRRKADELQQQRIELETQLAAAEARNNRTARALQDQNPSDALAVDQVGGLGNGGTPRLTQSPGASRRESVADMDAILNGLPPELRRCVKKIENNNQVVLVFTGDINIDQSRTIRIRGDNNTVSESQNGDDAATGVAMDGTSTNVIDSGVPPPPVEQFSPMPPPPRGDLEPAPMPVPPAPAEMPETPFDAESPTQPAPSGDLEEDVPGQE